LALDNAFSRFARFFDEKQMRQKKVGTPVGLLSFSGRQPLDLPLEY
jgi:hypothetical protein